MSDAPAANSRLDRLTLDLERHAAAAGWDQPPRLFALVETADLLRREPQLAAELGLAGDAPGDLTPVDQGDLPEHASLDELLAGIVWPAEVLGTALAVERLMVPPGGRAGHAAGRGARRCGWLAEHPERQEVRLVVAVLRDGSRVGRAADAGARRRDLGAHRARPGARPGRRPGRRRSPD